jgi:hypothetical protein
LGGAKNPPFPEFFRSQFTDQVAEIFGKTVTLHMRITLQTKKVDETVQNISTPYDYGVCEQL